MTLVLDNYDSFTYNLVQLVARHTVDFRVVRNDELTIADIETMKPDRILISPGPGRPENAGICVNLVKTLGPRIPILGVCLGHQAIGCAFGGKIVHAPQLMHGKTSHIQHAGEGIFSQLPNPFEATRYHSLVISPDDLPAELTVTARTADHVIMGIRHIDYPVEGIQFHPESVLTKFGFQIIANWMQ